MKVTFEASNFAELAVKLESALNELHTPASNHIVATPAAPANPTTLPPAGQQFITSSPANPAPIVSDYVDGSGLGVDAEGLPWDERIHSSNKKRTAKNIWVARRNVSDETYKAVVAELRGGVPAAPVVSTPPAPPVVAPAVENPADAFASIPAHLRPPAAPAAPLNPIVPAAPVVPTPPAPPVVATAKNIGDLITRIQGLFASGNADQQYIIGLQQRIGTQFGLTVNSIVDIQSRPDAIEYAFQLIAADGK